MKVMIIRNEKGTFGFPMIDSSFCELLSTLYRSIFSEITDQFFDNDDEIKTEGLQILGAIVRVVLFGGEEQIGDPEAGAVRKSSTSELLKKGLALGGHLEIIFKEYGLILEENKIRGSKGGYFSGE